MTAPVSFLYDYASPFSYIASVLIERGALGAVDYQPIYLRGLEMFSQAVPYSGGKLAYLMADLKRVAAHHRIPLEPPASFPVNGLYALRGALVALGTERFADYHRRAFAAVWGEGRELGNAAAVVELAREAGFSADDFATRAASPEIKDELRQRTERAADRGVFGVPAFFVGDELFWGHDRMDYVARALAAAQGA